MLHELPPMMTKAQTASFLQVSVRALDRMLNNGILPSVKLGTGRSAPVRIPRDQLMQSLGLLSVSEARRRKRVALAEKYAALALTGGR